MSECGSVRSSWRLAIKAASMRLKSTILYGSLLFFLTGMVRYTLPYILAVAAGVPPLTCDRAEYDFGILTPDQFAAHTFIVTNQSDQIIHELEAIPGCSGCTEVTCSTNALDPGESARINARFKLAGIRGKTTARIAVRAAELETPFVLRIRGNVASSVFVHPSSLTVNAKKLPLSTAFRVSSQTRSFRVMEVLTSHPSVKAEIIQPAAGKEHTISVTISDQFEKPPVPSSMTIVTDIPTERIIPVSIISD